MRRTADRPNVIKCATAPGVLETLQSNNSNLEKVKKSLDVRFPVHNQIFTFNSEIFVVTCLKLKYFLFNSLRVSKFVVMHRVFY